MKEKTTPTQRVLNLWAIILILWSFYRVNFKLPDWFDEFIAKPLVFVLPVYWYIKKYEKTNFFSALGLKTKKIKSDIFMGFVIGGLFYLAAVLANFLKYKKLILFNRSISDPKLIILTILIALATGISEEILSRGFVLKRLYQESKNIFSSSFFASILYFFLHIPMLFTNPKITGGFLIFFMGTDLVLSLITSFIFLGGSGLLLPILIHSFYNIAILLFI
jgi:membrane protease YdiL (CAAX protease family)